MSRIITYMIGVDIGTGSTKVIALLPDGAVGAVHQQAYGTHHPRPGYSEQDPDDILGAVKAGIAGVVGEMGHLPAGVSFSSAMHSIMAVNGAGRPLTPLIIWADNRSRPAADTWRDTEEGRALYRQTGTPVHPMSPFCKITWLRTQEPGLFAGAARFIGIKEYVLHHFFGRYIVDHSIASAMGLFDIHTRHWSPQALSIAGISAAQLAEPVPAGYALRGLPATLAAELGLPPNVPFIAGASDGCLAQLGSHALGAGHATLTIGTSGALRMAVPAPAADEKQRLFTYILNNSHYVTGGAINNGGVVLQWFVRDFLQRNGEGDIDACIQQALQLPPGGGGLISLPYLLGERAPVWDAHTSGTFIGIQPHHTHLHFLRALLEGIAFGLLSIAEALEQTAGPILKISVSGGFTASPGWIQLLADIFRQPMYLRQQNDASAIGAAMLAYETLDIPYESAAPAPAGIFMPAAADAYAGNYAVYKLLYEQLKGVFVLTSRIASPDQ